MVVQIKKLEYKEGDVLNITIKNQSRKHIIVFLNKTKYSIMPNSQIDAYSATENINLEITSIKSTNFIKLFYTMIVRNHTELKGEIICKTNAFLKSANPNSVLLISEKEKKIRDNLCYIMYSITSDNNCPKNLEYSIKNKYFLILKHILFSILLMFLPIGVNIHMIKDNLLLLSLIIIAWLLVVRKPIINALSSIKLYRADSTGDGSLC